VFAFDRTQSLLSQSAMPSDVLSASALVVDLNPVQTAQQPDLVWAIGLWDRDAALLCDRVTRTCAVDMTALLGTLLVSGGLPDTFGVAVFVGSYSVRCVAISTCTLIAFRVTG
jgi:hypothetical protein